MPLMWAVKVILSVGLIDYFLRPVWHGYRKVTKFSGILNISDCSVSFL